MIIGYILTIKEISLWHFNKVLSYYILYYIGVIIRNVNIQNIWTSKKKTAVIFIVSFVYIVYASINDLSIAWVSCIYKNPVISVLNTLAGWLFIKAIAVFIEKIERLKIIDQLGSSTLYILILHMSIYTVSRRLIEGIFGLKNYGYMWIIYTLMGIFIPYLIKKGINYCGKALHIG